MKTKNVNGIVLPAWEDVPTEKKVAEQNAMMFLVYNRLPVTSLTIAMAIAYLKED